MTTAISAASATPQTSITAAPVSVARAAAAPAPPAAAAAGQPAAASSGQAQAALNQLLSKYKYAQSHNAAASALSSLSRQILAAAKTMGQHVTLPRAPASSGAAAAAPEASAPATPGKVSITA